MFFSAKYQKNRTLPGKVNAKRLICILIFGASIGCYSVYCTVSHR